MSALLQPLINFVRSSIGRKILVALSGAVLVVYVLGHMIGNLLIYAGPDAINEYGHLLHTIIHGAGIWIARGVMLLAVVVHVVLTIILTKENAAAREQRYAVKEYIQASKSSRIMIWTGLTLLAFVIYHLLHFTIRAGNNYDSYSVMLHGEQVHDVYKMVVAGFSWAPASIFYIISMGLLCSHLGHGTSSMFQSLGLSNERLRPVLGKLGWCFAVVIFLANISIPISVMLGLVK